jgi:hypothetical protein
MAHAGEEVYAGLHDVPAELWHTLVPPVEVGDEGGAFTDAPPRPNREPDKAPAKADEEVAPAEEAEGKKRKGRARRRGLRWVNVGLAVHYGGMLVFLLGLAAGWVAVVLLLGALVSLGTGRRDTAPTASALGMLLFSGVLFLSSSGLVAVSSVADIVSSAFCLRVPDGTSRGLLIASLCARLLALPVAVVVYLFAPAGLVTLASGALVVLGWVLWVLFLRGLALSLKQPKLGEEAVSITFGVLKFTLGWVVALAVVVVVVFFFAALVRVGGCFAYGLLFAIATAFAGFVRYLIVSDRFESITMLLLYPTGIPLVLRYLDLIGTTRMIILRRS